ncbi:MAG: hypothetical protein PWQ28_308 [Candidatus Woesearchaeota archaeon]|nr:hypothetical protein [Candidatus Woesearchaeota archaeon]
MIKMENNNDKKEGIITNFVLYSVGCSNECVFCGKVNRGDIDKNLRDEYDKLKEISNKSKIEFVEISGNDPIEYEKITEVIWKIKQISKAKKIMLSTHGRNLANKDLLKSILEAGVTSLRIPIYGHNASIHDSITQSKGSFEDVMRALENIYYLDNKPELIITSLILKENQYNLKELFYLISKIKFAKEFHLSIAGFVPSKRNFIKSIPDFEDLKRDLNDSLKFSKRLKLKLIIRDIPVCITKDDKIPHADFSPPYKGYKHFGLEDYGVPIYMQKKKTKECESCVYNDSCEGFFRTYIEGGFIKLTPLLKKL